MYLLRDNGCSGELSRSSGPHNNRTTELRRPGLACHASPTAGEYTAGCFLWRHTSRAAHTSNWTPKQDWASLKQSVTASLCGHIASERLTYVGQVAGTCGWRYTPGTWSAAETAADERNRTLAAADAAIQSRCWWGCDAGGMLPSSTCHINRHCSIS